MRWPRTLTGVLSVALAAIPSGSAAAAVGAAGVAEASRADWVQVSVGGSFACAVQAHQTLWCWGAGASGQLGDGSTAMSDVPVQVGSDSDWVAVSAGATSTCAVKDDGSAWCWGANDHGQLGDGTTDSSDIPVRVSGSGDWQSVSVGSQTACGLQSDGTAWCWGDNTWGELGDGDQTSSLIPVRVKGSRWVGVSEGVDYACAVKSAGTAWCWGNGAKGALGDGQKGWVDTPQRVLGPRGWSGVAAGDYDTTCGTRSDGSAWCWGWGKFGQTGAKGAKQMNLRPVRVSGKGTWQDVSPGHLVTCGVKTGGVGYCWGDNALGMLGAGQQDQPAMTPIRIAKVSDLVDVSVGADSACAVDADGAAWCWGDNGDGELGHGTVGGVKDKPVRV